VPALSGCFKSVRQLVRPAASIVRLDGRREAHGARREDDPWNGVLLDPRHEAAEQIATARQRLDALVHLRKLAIQGGTQLGAGHQPVVAGRARQDLANDVRAQAGGEQGADAADRVDRVGVVGPVAVGLASGDEQPLLLLVAQHPRAHAALAGVADPQQPPRST
jgi:hypothetical protein